MNINRHERYTPLNLVSRYFSPDSVYSPNTEMWAKVLEKQQGIFDQAKTFSQMSPTFLEQDRNAAEQWQQKHQDSINKITQLYNSNDPNGIELGNRALSEYSARLKKDVSTGDFYNLGRRKQEYQKALEYIVEQNKDNPAIAKEYSMHLLNQSVKGNDLLQSINPTGLGKYQDLEKQWQETKKALESEETGTFQVGNTYVTKTETKGWNPDRIKAAFEGVVKDEKNKFTIDANAWAKSRNIDPEKYAQYLNETNQKSVSQNKEVLNQIDKTLSSGNKSDIKNLQQAMKQSGIDVSVDGVAGNETKEAVSLYKDIINKQIKDNSSKSFKPEDINLQEVGKQSYLRDQEKYFNSLFGYSKKTEFAGWNQFTLQSQRIAAQRQMQEDYIMKLKESFIAPPTEGIVMPDTPLQETRQIGDAVKVAKDAIANNNVTINDGMKTFARGIGLQSGLEFDQPTFNALMQAAKESSDQYGNVNKMVLQNKLKQKGQWWVDKFNPDAISSFFNGNSESAKKVKAAGDVYEGNKVHEFTVKSAENMWNSVVDLANNNGSMQAAWQKEFNKYGKRGETLDSFIQNVMSNQGQVDKSNRFYTTRQVGGKESTTNTEHNIANEIVNRVNQNTNNKLQDAVNKSQHTYRYSQEDDKTPVGALSKQVNNDIQNGLFKGYGIDGQDGLKWQDISGNEISVKDPSKISNVRTSFVMTPTGLMMSIVADTKDGDKTKTLKTYSDIRPELKPTVITALKSEAFEITKSNPDLAGKLANSAFLLENGFSSLPDVKYRNTPVTSKQQQIGVVGKQQNYAITDNISNDFIAPPKTIRGNKVGLKRVGYGDSEQTVMVLESVDATGNKIQNIIKANNGELSDSPVYYYNDYNTALKELNLFSLKSDEKVMQNVEIQKQKRAVSNPQAKAAATSFNITNNFNLDDGQE